MSLNRAVSETPPAAEQPASPPAPSKKSRKRIFAAAGIIAVGAVALSLIFVFLASQKVGATISLSYNYTPGEEMTYNLTGSSTNALGQNSSVTETVSMNVISFDGENYTINETMTLSMPPSSPMSFSYTEKMNKTGYVTDVNGSTEMLQTYSSFGGIGSFWQKDEARVGDTWQVPMYLGNSTYITYDGNLTLKFGEIQDVTVPAGAYRVFRVDVSGINVSMVINVPTPANMSIFENFTVIGQMYFEYGTCRLVESDLQEDISILAGTQVSAQNMSMHMELVKHTGH